MWKNLLRTDHDIAPLVLRLTLGIVIFPHGAQKLLGWFGGYGFAGTMQFFTQTMGIPWILALLVVIAEFFGALALIAGFLTRLSAFGIGSVMAGAIAMVHWQHGFFMNWSGQQAGEGFEFHLLAIGIAIALMVKGGGAASVDGELARRT
jgi:putative oxidoreductase